LNYAAKLPSQNQIKGNLRLENFSFELLMLLISGKKNISSINFLKV
jgi:hypothetical protein